MHVARIGFTPIKGGRHRSHPAVRLERTGPVGDRTFCLVDPGQGRCLRTIDHPALLQASATWDGETLSVDLPSGTISGEPAPSGEVLTVDYWGRYAEVAVVAGPWAAALSDHLGRDVVLARNRPGDVVYGGPVTLVTQASLTRLADRVGAPVDGARFRSTFELAGDDLRAGDEAAWIGRRLRLGAAEVRVTQGVPRCAVIDLDPASGVRDLALMKALGGATTFGVDAEVTVPGTVAAADRATVHPLV